MMPLRRRRPQNVPCFFPLVVAAVCGMICVLCRLWDFRGTASRALGHEEAPTQDGFRGLGRMTWGLFYAQFFSFLVGIAALALALLLTFGGKLA